jgi:hypothetical protein
MHNSHVSTGPPAHHKPANTGLQAASEVLGPGDAEVQVLSQGSTGPPAKQQKRAEALVVPAVQAAMEDSSSTAAFQSLPGTEPSSAFVSPASTTAATALLPDALFDALGAGEEDGAAAAAASPEPAAAAAVVAQVAAPEAVAPAAPAAPAATTPEAAAQPPIGSSSPAAAPAALYHCLDLLARAYTYPVSAAGLLSCLCGTGGVHLCMSCSSASSATLLSVLSAAGVLADVPLLLLLRSCRCTSPLVLPWAWRVA